MTLKLYAHPFSSYCQKVLIALYENGTPFAYPHARRRDARPMPSWRRSGPSSAFPCSWTATARSWRPASSSSIWALYHPGPVRLIPQDPRGSARGADDGSLLRQLRHDADAEDRLRLHAPRGGSRPVRRRRGARDARHGLWLARQDARRARVGGGRARSAWPIARRLRRCSMPTGSIRSARRIHTFGLIGNGCSRRPSFARAVDEARPYRHFFPPGAPDRD